MNPIFSVAYTKTYKMTDTLVYLYLHVRNLSNISYRLEYMENTTSLYLLIS